MKTINDRVINRLSLRFELAKARLWFCWAQTVVGFCVAAYLGPGRTFKGI
jgi:hypothetical protein